MKSLLKVPADALDRLTPDALELYSTLRARGWDDVADELLLARLEPGIVGVQITGVPSADPPIQYSQQPIDHPYAKGKAINLGATTIPGAAGSAFADIVTAGYQWLTVLARIGNATTPATAAGDISIQTCAYEDDGTTVFPAGNSNGVSPDFTVRAASLQGTVAYIASRYNLSGIDKVKAILVNNNVAALQGGTLMYYLQK